MTELEKLKAKRAAAHAAALAAYDDAALDAYYAARAAYDDAYNAIRDAYCAYNAALSAQEKEQDA
jgi:hypothetical protein